MRVALCGWNQEELKQTLADFSFKVVEKNPEVVISYGGDGVLLGAERKYPGVPKCPVRDAKTHPQCADHDERKVLSLLNEDKLKKTTAMKLEGEKAGHHNKLYALNDVVINKQIMTSCVRYRIWLDGTPYADQIVGDGLVVATPFGSTAYYRSITRSLFQTGIGVAFNNSTEPFDHLLISEGTEITVEIIRGPAVVMADNDPQRIPLEEGEQAHVRKSPQGTVLLGIDIFRCPLCSNQRQNSFPMS